jgi:eukaryotic-like serine/threonine-protein kinase
MAGHDRILDALSAEIGDKYEVLRWIGGGGMAEVYLVRHRKHQGLAAVKVLSPKLVDDPRTVERFMQEAQTAATLSGHPNIVPIFDVGQGHDLNYLIMQYVAGEDLRTYIEREVRIPARDAVNIVSQVANALVFAASKGIVHRDLKPANIRLDQHGRVIVLDFGIAKAGDRPNMLTAAGERIGTVYYMCPEQIRGETCDPRSDLYALGVILYELLTGSRPFEGDSCRAIEDGHLFGVPVAPAEVDAGIPAEASGIAMRLMEKDPARRFQTAAELLTALRQLASRLGEGEFHPHTDMAEQSEDGVAEEEAAPAPRPRIRLIAAVAALALALLGAALYMTHKSGVRSIPIKPAQATNVTPALPPAISDVNGRMVLIPAGEFIFGDDSPDSPNPRRRMALPAFYIDATEVSNAAYARFCESANRPAPNVDLAAKGGYPAVEVSLEDAQAFAAWAGKRIPTEQEWEKAARGSDGRIYPWGNNPEALPQSVQPVDALPQWQSPYGALNMAGNVWEWTGTLFPVTNREIEDMQRNGQAAVSRDWYIIKGGSFSPHQEPFWRCFMRRGWPKNLGSSQLIGFRCVKDVKTN